MKSFYHFLITFFLILTFYFVTNHFARKIEGYDILTDIVRLCFSAIVLFFSIKYKLLKIDFLKSNIVLTLIFIFIVCTLSINYVINEVTHQSSFNNNNNNKHLIYIISSFAPSLFEELLFRLFLFAGLYKYLYSFKLPKFTRTVIITSIIFALSHSINFSNPEYVQLSVIAQVLFAFGVGLFLQSLFIRYRNILIPIIIHGIINYIGMYKSQLIQTSRATEAGSYTLNDLFITLFVFSVIIIIFVLPITYFSLKHKVGWHNILVKDDTPSNIYPNIKN